MPPFSFPAEHYPAPKQVVAFGWMRWDHLNIFRLHFEHRKCLGFDADGWFGCARPKCTLIDGRRLNEAQCRRCLHCQTYHTRNAYSGLLVHTQRLRCRLSHSPAFVTTVVQLSNTNPPPSLPIFAPNSPPSRHHPPLQWEFHTRKPQQRHCATHSIFRFAARSPHTIISRNSRSLTGSTHLCLGHIPCSGPLLVFPISSFRPVSPRSLIHIREFIEIYYLNVRFRAHFFVSIARRAVFSPQEKHQNRWLNTCHGVFEQLALNGMRRARPLRRVAAHIRAWRANF